MKTPKKASQPNLGIEEGFLEEVVFILGLDFISTSRRGVGKERNMKRGRKVSQKKVQVKRILQSQLI